ncbi:MAG: MFS transporter [Candidatus Bathyarchaeales archaeon]
MEQNRRLKIFRVPTPFKFLNRDLKLIFICNLIGSFGDGLYAYTLPRYLTGRLGADSVELGILYAIMSLVAAITLFVAGMLADKYDRKKIMIAGWVAWIPAPIIFSIANNWVHALPGMVMWGFWLGGPTTTAYVVTSADNSRLSSSFMALSAAWSLGYIFSPGIGGYLSEAVGYQIVFYSAAALYTFAALILVFTKSQKGAKHRIENSREDVLPLRRLIRFRKLLFFSAFFASVMFTVMLFRPFVPSFLSDIYGYQDFEIGVFGSISFFGSAVLGILLGKVGDKWKKAYALAASLVLCSFSLILLLLFGDFPILTLVFFLTGGSYMTWSLMSAIVGPTAPESSRARWVAIPQTISMFVSVLAPYIGGFLYAISPYHPFIVAITASLLLAAFALWLLKE